jgi:hypothetical protein
MGNLSKFSQNNLKMNEIVQYILGFLLGDAVSPTLLSQIAYSKDRAEFHQYKLVILQSSFFDQGMYATEMSLPQLPLQIWEETPILFGKPIVEVVDGTLVLHADLVASTYFLISRYEEMVRKEVRMFMPVLLEKSLCHTGLDL